MKLCSICNKTEIEDYEHVCDTCMRTEKELERIEHEAELFG